MINGRLAPHFLQDSVKSQAAWTHTTRSGIQSLLRWPFVHLVAAAAFQPWTALLALSIL